MDRPSSSKTSKAFCKPTPTAATTASTPAPTARSSKSAAWPTRANKFSEADSTDPERVLAAKAWVRKLYDVEDEAKAIIAAEKLTGAAAAAVRLRLRKEKAVPLLTSLRQWLVEQKEQVLPKSPIAAAINYMLNQWDALNRYTSDGDLHIDNNISERTLKLIGMGRINWLFLGSDKGGLTAAVLFSFTATCKHLHIDTFAYPDKKATETKAAELERRGIRIDAGLVDPADVHAKRPLAEHAEDFRRYLAAKGNTSEHVGHTMSRLLACLDGCRFIKIGDLQPSAVVGFLADLRAAGKSIATANYYLVATKSFTRWLWRDKRVAADPLAGMSKLAHADTDVRHARREWSADECLRLFEAARTSNRPYRFLTGPDRFALYLTSAGTGLRASELASLTPASFELDATPAVVRLQSAYAKNRKQAELPLPAEVADVLRDYLASKPADLPIWPGTWNQDAAEMIRGDLNEAREQWLQSIQDARQRTQAEQSDFLAYCDTEGRFIDFHALRHTYISRIVRSGATPKAAQSLARHSTVTLTLGRYAHVALHDLSAAVDALPDLLPPNAERQALAATGTDGKGPDREFPPSISLGPFLGPQPAISGDFERQGETEVVASADDRNHEETKENAAFSKWPRPDSNRHGGYPPGDFKSPETIEKTGLFRCFRPRWRNCCAHQPMSPRICTKWRKPSSKPSVPA